MQRRIICAIFVIATLISPVAWGDQEEELRAWDCPVCHAPIESEDAIRCRNCGETIVPHEKLFICPLCGTENAYHAWKCTYCGLPFRYPKPLSFSERLGKRWQALRPSLGEWHGMYLNRGIAYAHAGTTQNDITGTPVRDTSRVYGYGRLELSWRKQWNDTRVFVDAFAQQDTRHFFHEMEGGSPRERPILGMREAFVDTRLSDIDFRIGKQVWTWGKSDTVHLVDVLNPDDRTDLLSERRFGSFGVGATMSWGETDIDCVVIPEATSTLLPPKESRFSVFPYSDTLLEQERAGAIAAVRIARTDADIDWSIVGVSGSDLMPHLAPSNTPFAFPRLVFPQRHMLGVTGETLLGDFGVRGEAITIIPGDDVDKRVAAVLGVDREWGDVFTARDRLYVNIEGVAERVIHEGTLIEFPRPFTRTVSGVMEYGVGAWTARCAVAHSFAHTSETPRVRGGDTYVRPELRWEATRNIEVRVSADVFSGPRDSFFGFFRDHDRVTLDVRVTF